MLLSALFVGQERLILSSQQSDSHWFPLVLPLHHLKEDAYQSAHLSRPRFKVLLLILQQYVNQRGISQRLVYSSDVSCL